MCHTFDISRWLIEHNRRKVGNARSRINNSTFYNRTSMTSSIAGKIPICGFVEGCWHLKEGRETPLTSIQVIAVENALFYCIRQERDRLLIRKCWSGGRMIFLISCFVLRKLQHRQVSERLKTGEIVDNLRAFILSWCFNKMIEPFRILGKSLPIGLKAIGWCLKCNWIITERFVQPCPLKFCCLFRKERKTYVTSAFLKKL